MKKYKINGVEIEALMRASDMKQSELTIRRAFNELLEALAIPAEEQSEPILKKEYRYSTITGNHLGTFLVDSPLEKNQTNIKPEPKKNYKRWRADLCEKYWLITHSGFDDFSIEKNDKYDERRYNTGNYYQTKELAQKALDKQLATQRVIDRINELNEGWVADWSDWKRKKHYIYYSFAGKSFFCDKNYCCESSPFLPPMESEEVANKIIKEYEDDLKIIWRIN